MDTNRATDRTRLSRPLPRPIVLTPAETKEVAGAVPIFPSLPRTPPISPCRPLDPQTPTREGRAVSQIGGRSVFGGPVTKTRSPVGDDSLSRGGDRKRCRSRKWMNTARSCLNPSC